MPFPPIDKTMEGVLRDTAERLTLVERRLATAGTGDGGGSGDGAPAAAPAGTVAAWSGSATTVPSGWLLCNGQAVPRAAYTSLFAAIGTTYGAGDGSTTFNVPNGKGRVIVGQDTTQVEFDVVGETGGAKTVTLTAAQSGLRSHRHDMYYGTTAGANDANDPVLRAHSGGAGLDRNFRTGTPRETSIGASLGSGYGSSPMDNVPATDAHTNLQPYIVQNWIISTGAGSNAPVPILPVALWQEFTLDLAGALNQPVNGGAVVWNGPIGGNLGATLDGTKTTIRLPSAGTYRIVTHIGHYATNGQNVSGTIYVGGAAVDRANFYGTANTANVFNTDIEITITVNGPTTFTQGVSAASIYRWSWMRIEKVEPFFQSTALAVQQGSTALRDATYGVPGGDSAATVSLANRKIVWYNTDKGWFESFYATTGMPGLTVPGLNSAVASGWFPEGGSPIFATLMRTTGQAGVTGNGLWILYDKVLASRGFSITVPTEYLMPPYAGVYEISCSAVVSQTGGNYFDLWLKINGANFRAESGTQFPHTNAYSRATILPVSTLIPLNQDIRTLASSSSAGTVIANTPTLTVRYVGPPLA